MTSKIAKFATEADLCAAFIEDVTRRGDYTPYAETAGWDILLVRNADGFQIGVQAKLRFNIKVLAQALEYSEWVEEGPDVRAILVPETMGFDHLAAYLGLAVFKVRGSSGSTFDPQLPNVGRLNYIELPEWCPVRRCKLPEYIPDVIAGSSAPVKLTPWKIKALKVMVILERDGKVTRKQFNSIGIDHRRWTAPGSGWLVPMDKGTFKRGEKLPDFIAQHPIVYAQVKADMAIKT